MIKKPWYPVPFKIGHVYRATSEVLGHFDRIVKDERLVYKSTGSSHYDGYIGFFFTDSSGAQRRWDIYNDTNPVEEARKVFIDVNAEEEP
ncbi:hypothetical protein BH11VER1_BH11VER1_20480 [soil metagenome]